MYTDTLLFITSGAFAFLVLVLAVYLASSYKRSLVYRTLLRQETEFYDALSSTVMTGTLGAPVAGSGSGSGGSAGLQGGGDVQSVDRTASTQIGHCGNTTELQGADEPGAGRPGEEAHETVEFDASALEGRYVLKTEIHGGGMSRVFLAESVKLGNRWIVKFIPDRNARLANEEDILKLLNHVSLPKIVDIFKDDRGVYLVESYIEGVTLDKVMQSGRTVNQVVILDWAEQLAKALNYLHNLEPHPIYHFDIKPTNIMVTHDNRLVIIDFGVSKRFGEDDGPAVGVTYQYAAPEQFKRRITQKYLPLLVSRFGELPEKRFGWEPGARTDIYSLGVILFELAVGHIPTAGNKSALKGAVSRELADIIGKCLSVDPAGRYRSAEELLAALQAVKSSRVKMARTLFRRRLASVLCVATLLASVGSMTSGYYIYGLENAAGISIHPEIVNISLRQSSSLTVEKRMPNGGATLLDSAQIVWSASHDNIARIDGNRILGLNSGQTEISGLYRNKEISLTVRVTEPMNGAVEISQRYQPGRSVRLFAGSAERDHIDGPLSAAEFVSPESIAASGDGDVYISDSWLLRAIREWEVESVDFEPAYLTPKIVRCHNDGLFILTHEWEDGDGVFYGFIKLTDDGAEGLFATDARYTAVEDFIVAPDGVIYFIERNAGANGVFLKTLNPGGHDDIHTLCELPYGTSCLAMGGEREIYLANPETGAIQVWKDGTLAYFAGIENEKAFIDGTAPLFYMPQKIKYDDGFLYIWDFNVLRRITVANGAAGECVTVAGVASPEFEAEIKDALQAAEDIVLPNSALTDFVVLKDKILITDPKRGVIWEADK